MPSTESKARLRAALLLLLTLATGIVLGVLGDRVVLLHQRRILPSEKAGKIMAGRIATRLDRELKLTPEQRKSVEEILERHRVRIEAAWNNVRPQVRSEIETADREIRAVLNEEQRSKYVKMRKDFHRPGSDVLSPR